MTPGKMHSLKILSLTRFPFIFALVVTKEVLGYTKALSTKLQGRYIDVARAYNEVSSVQEVLESARKDVDSFTTESMQLLYPLPGKLMLIKAFQEQQVGNSIDAMYHHLHHQSAINVNRPYQLLIISHLRFLNGFPPASQ